MTDLNSLKLNVNPRTAGRQVSGGSHDGDLRLWRSAGGGGFDLERGLRLRAHTGPVVSLALDSRRAVSP